MTKNINIDPATPVELKAWAESDYFMSGVFEPTSIMVVIPTLIQLTFIGAMIIANKVFGGIF